MATLSVTSGPNPVAFTPSGVTRTRPVTVSWDTGLHSAGRVSRRIDGGPDEPFGTGPAGSADTDVALNQTHTFTLRSGIGQVLATLIVTTVLETADLPLRPTHRIDVTRAVVGECSVQLRWRTSRSTACSVEITAPGHDPVFAWTAEGAVHHARFDGLQPGTDHTVRILPEGGTGRYLGAVRTGRREDGDTEAGAWTPDPEAFRQLRLRVVEGAGRCEDTAGDGDSLSVAHRGAAAAMTAMSPTGRLRLRYRGGDGTWCDWVDLGTVLPPGSHAVHWEDEGLLAVTSVDADNLVRVLSWRDPPRARGRGDWITVGTLAGVDRPPDANAAR